jgi:type IV pilus assembly protein PilE
MGSSMISSLASTIWIQIMIKKNKSTANSGFTLIELMIALAIIAILTAIAYPSYQDSVRQARRADAQADIIQYAGFAERIFTEINRYDTANGATIARSGIASNFYNYGTVLTPTTYVITAIPQGGQAADTCGTMTLTQAGARNNNGTAAGCWN